MVIDYTEEGLNHSFDLGGIFHPFVLCDYELEAFDNRGQTLFVITAERCACNIYCCFGCDSCNKSAFKVKDMYENVLGAIEIVIFIEKKLKIFNYFLINIINLFKGTHYQTCIPGTHECDYFSVTFPPFLGPNERTLLLSAMIFISTRLFSRGLGTQTSLE